MKTAAKWAILTGLFLTIAFVSAIPVHAEYPEKPIKLIVPYSPGGTTDVLCRILAKYMEPHLKQKIVVMNVKGGGGQVGWTQLKGSKPDGYTIAPFVDSIPVMEATKSATFTQEDFEPIAMFGNVFLTVFGKPDGPYQTLKDIREAALKNPGKIGLAMGNGTPSQFYAAAVEEGMGADLNLVNVGGGAQKKAAVMGGHVATGIEPTPGIIGPHRAGHLKVLAILAGERLKYLSDLPTAKEQGVDVIAYLSYGLIAPKNTPRDRLKTLEQAVVKANANEEYLKKMQDVNMVPNYKSMEELAEYMKELRVRILKIGKKLGY